MRGGGVVPHAGTWIEILCLIGTIAPDTVVPHAGTWIEIALTRLFSTSTLVVPHAGTWIEIVFYCKTADGSLDVVPHAGTWIEIYVVVVTYVLLTGRSPRGNVD